MSKYFDRSEVDSWRQIDTSTSLFCVSMEIFKSSLPQKCLYRCYFTVSLDRQQQFSCFPLLHMVWGCWSNDQKVTHTFAWRYDENRAFHDAWSLTFCAFLHLNRDGTRCRRVFYHWATGANFTVCYMLKQSWHLNLWMAIRKAILRWRYHRLLKPASSVICDHWSFGIRIRATLLLLLLQLIACIFPRPYSIPSWLVIDLSNLCD